MTAPPDTTSAPRGLEGQWVLEHRDELKERSLGQFEASFPGLRGDGTERDLTTAYVEVRCGKRRAYLQARLRRGATGRTLYVPTGVLPGGPKGMKVSVKRATKSRFTLHVVRHDPSLWAALWGFVVAVVGLLIEAAFDVGEVVHLATVDARTAGVLIGLSWVMKVVGLVIAFGQAVLAARG